MVITAGHEAVQVLVFVTACVFRIPKDPKIEI